MNEIISVCPGYHDKISQVGSLKQQKFIFSEFQRLGIQIKLSLWLFLGSLSSWLADGHLFTMSSHGHFVHAQREKERERKVLGLSSVLIRILVIRAHPYNLI